MVQTPIFGSAVSSVTTRLGFVTLLLVSFVLAGCDSIPRAGPGERSITKDAGDLAGFTQIDINRDTIAPYLLKARGDTAGTSATTISPRVRLAPGDVLRVTVAESREGGVFAPLAIGGTSFQNVRVDYKGTISIPYAGRVPVAGLDPQRVEDRIRSRISGVAFEPQVYIELVADRTNTVLVTGEVRAPGRFSLLEGPLTILDAINRAGGAVRAPHQTDVVLRRGRTVKRFSLSYLQGGENIQLQQGDEIVLEANNKVYNVLGAVTKTGQLEFPKADPSLLDGLSQAGGLSNNIAHNVGVFVFRLEEPQAYRDAQGNWHAAPVIFKFDMSRPEMFFFAQAFALRNNDTIYVTNAPSVEWARAIGPLAQSLGAVRGTVSTFNSVDNLGGP
ncbi:polysaccharide biosynthesis/export family protein [soil metagenome]